MNRTPGEIVDYAHALSMKLYGESKIDGHEIDMDGMSGAIFINANDNWTMYCSPMWESNFTGAAEGISIVWWPKDDNPKKDDMMTLPFVPTFDLDTDKTNYIAIVSKYVEENAHRFAV